MNTRYFKKLAKGALLFGATLLTMTSCGDFFDVDPVEVVRADQSHLDTPQDSIYSMTGILNKLQAIADRTVLLGEARGDLVNITDATQKDLRELALFNVSEENGGNKYNNPIDYYQVINNCNYFIAKADTTLKDSHGQNIFLNEYAAVKAIRAWTYLQLVTTYGKVPFYTEPILDQSKKLSDFPVKDIKQVCDYFIYEDGLDKLAANTKITFPSYGDIKGVPSKLFYFPINLVLGDLRLWAASFSKDKNDYWEAAKCYRDYIVKRNGETGYYATQVRYVRWRNAKWYEKPEIEDTWSQTLTEEKNDPQSETIALIPMDSIASEGYYSELRAIFNTDHAKDNNYRVSLTPSQAMKNLSAAQTFCFYDKEQSSATDDVFKAGPTGLKDCQDGDLRLWAVWNNTRDGKLLDDGSRIDYQSISKTLTKNGNIHIYRRSQVYLRMAEAMNRAGYPFYAYMVLANGISPLSEDTICKVYKADSIKIMDNMSLTSYPQIVRQGNVSYVVRPYMYLPYYELTQIAAYKDYGNIGIHTHGSGWGGYWDTYTDNPAFNYQMPAGTLEQQMDAVEDMIIDENALEMAFEGKRFYDLMRVALRRNDPAYLADRIAKRNGNASNGISANLLDTKNWFLRWNKQIGMY